MGEALLILKNFQPSAAAVVSSGYNLKEEVLGEDGGFCEEQRAKVGK